MCNVKRKELTLVTSLPPPTAQLAYLLTHPKVSLPCLPANAAAKTGSAFLSLSPPNLFLYLAGRFEFPEAFLRARYGNPEYC